MDTAYNQYNNKKKIDIENLEKNNSLFKQKKDKENISININNDINEEIIIRLKTIHK